ncbi:restriction endonuclease [Shewanella sp. MR-4]|nr:restriction endonuclease [Shewanella sp. MR-4]
MVSSDKIIDHKILSLDEWLSFISVPRNERNFQILDCQFATDSHREEYISNIQSRSLEEVNYLISQFLIEGGSLGYDRFLLDWLLSHPREKFEAMIEKSRFLKRLLVQSDDVHTWPDITWVLDLLPHYPQEAIQAIESYFQAHCQFFPDGRIFGLGDAQALIRAKYMNHALPACESVLSLSPRDFELLVGYLYQKKGYGVVITPRVKDGGYDVEAEIANERGTERLHIECKRYQQKIGVAIARQVLGTLSVSNATKAVIVSSSYFTKPALDEARRSKRLELISIKNFDEEMRKYCSYNWVVYIDRYIMEIKNSHNKHCSGQAAECSVNP